MRGADGAVWLLLVRAAGHASPLGRCWAADLDAPLEQASVNVEALVVDWQRRCDVAAVVVASLQSKHTVGSWCG
jgi:hypothetical protein